MSNDHEQNPICLSLGIMAWNEESSIRATLESLFQQSIFSRLNARHERCEILCLANGCTDRTTEVAREVFAQMEREHPYAEAFVARVVEIPEPGRNNTWNRFVHEFSSTQARFICLMDADIIFHRRETLYNLMATLERKPRAAISTGFQYKHVLFKARKTLRDRISLATSDLTSTIEGRFSGQLYCMKAKVARNLRVPRNLTVNDDGFFKAIVCTDFLTNELDPGRIVVAPNAAHVFEAYVSPREVLNNQKRQMIGQTGVHVLLEYLKTRPLSERTNLAETLSDLEARDPDWLKKLMDEHVRSTRHFWELFPGVLRFRFERLWRLKGLRRWTHFPATLVGFGVTLVACWRAHRFLRAGLTEYWPKARRETLLNVPQLKTE